LRSVNSRAGNADSAAPPDAGPAPDAEPERAVTAVRPPARRLHGLRARVIAALVFLPCFGIIAWRGEYYFVILVNYIALAASFEFQRLLEAKEIRGQKGTALVGGILLPWLAYLNGGVYAGLGLTLIVLASMTAELWRPVGESLLRSAAGITAQVYRCQGRGFIG